MKMEERIENARAECEALAKTASLSPDRVDAICEKYSLTDKEMWAVLFGIQEHDA